MVASSIFYTEESRWFMEQLLALESGTENGGIYANKKGYHNTRANNQKSWPGNYSIIDSVDKAGPNDKAAAYDWTFPSAQNGHYERISYYTNLLLKSAKDLNDPRLNGWREFYGQANSDTKVEGWDTRYGISATSDSSHLWHIHMSETRGLVGSTPNKIAMLSVLKNQTVAQWQGAEFDMMKFIKVPDSKYGKDAIYKANGVTRVYVGSNEEVQTVSKLWGISTETSATVDSAYADKYYGYDVESLRGRDGVDGAKGQPGDTGAAGLGEGRVKEIIDENLSQLKITR